ncbi:hypothetical protein CVT26_013774 [Gymnopilus dilepis]|uniref:Uncharacterized protein n=1 Tax=Gymnopilus dilepis TaxID=231916 RepID=A0A409Y6C5_9AGAR|nr:hypothetical protein CVT26_013774 [Gymnopilus dilepis]
MTSRDSTKPASIVAFPSVSSSLHSLPQATSIQNVNLHPNMFAQRAAETTKSPLKNAVIIYTAVATNGVQESTIITFSRSFIWSDDADKIKILDLNMSPCSSPFPSLDSTFYGPCPPALPPLDSAA